MSAKVEVESVGWAELLVVGLVAIRRTDFVERSDLSVYQESVVGLAVVAAAAAVAAGQLVVVAVVVAAAAAAVAALLVVAPEAAAAVAAAGFEWSSAPCDTAPIPDSDLKGLHLPCPQI